MATHALDIVLIPDPAVVEFCVNYNADLRLQGDDVIRLSAEAREGFGRPHLSLGMLCIHERFWERLEQAIGFVATETSPLSVATSRVQSRPNNRGTNTHALLFPEDVGLENLHERVVEACHEVPRVSCTESAFVADDDKPHPRDINWVGKFIDEATGANFHPHITLGFGESHQATPAPTLCEFSTLALYRLGAGCTCREELKSFLLSGS